MSSNIEIQKVCKCCGNVFVARKTTTECCSHKCSSTLYKARKRGELVNTEKTRNENEIFKSKIQAIQDKPILTITETALFIGVSRPTVYQYIRSGELQSMRLGWKNFIKVEDIMALFRAKNFDCNKQSSESTPILDIYTIYEIMDKYKIRESWVYKIVRDKKIPKIYKRGRCYYSKPDVDKHFKKKDISITEWYTVEEATKKFGVTRDSLYHHIHANNVPKLKEGRYIKISKSHLDAIFEQPIIL